MMLIMLIAYLLQAGGGLAAPNQHVLAVRDTEDTAAVNTNELTNAATNAATNVMSSTVNGATNAINTTGNQLSSLMSATGTMLRDFGSESSQTVEEVLKATGRAALAIGNLGTQLFDGISGTAAVGTEYLATGTNQIHSYMGNLPILGVLTGGLSNFITDFSSKAMDLSTFGRERRQKMMNNLREKLNNSIRDSLPAGPTKDSIDAVNSNSAPVSTAPVSTTPADAAPTKK